MCTFRLFNLHHWIFNIMLYAVVIWHLFMELFAPYRRHNLLYLRLKFKAQYRTQTNICTSPFNMEKGSIYIYYPYRAFGGQNKIVYSTRFVRRAIFFLILPGQYFFNIARTLCDQSFNIDLRLRYVVRIHSSENRAMPRPS